LVSGPRSTNLLADDLENGYDGRLVIQAVRDPAVRVPLVSQSLIQNYSGDFSPLRDVV